jgi:hypothetical protein
MGDILAILLLAFFISSVSLGLIVFIEVDHNNMSKKFDKLKNQ